MFYLAAYKNNQNKWVIISKTLSDNIEDVYRLLYPYTKKGHETKIIPIKV
jgi:hypothetical protein